MLPGTTANVAGPTFATRPSRAWYASRSAITRLGPLLSVGRVVAPQRCSVAATSVAANGVPAARRMPSTARRNNSP